MFLCKEFVNVICVLSMDVVQKVKFGYLGVFMGMVDIVEVLWCDFLKYNLQNLFWVDCDCFVLFNGYGFMLIYSLLYFIGYDLLMEELKNFCQLYFKILGYLEVGYIVGVEIIIGLLGQGIVNVVGMVIVEKMLVVQFNCLGYDIVDYYIYVFMGDGCMMEGIFYEVCFLVGMLKLGKLIVFYDDNGIFIDGYVEGWFIDDIVMCFEVYGWYVICDIDGYDVVFIKCVVEEVCVVIDKFFLLMCKIIIGFGFLNKVGIYDFYGVLLGDVEIVLICE